MSDILAKICDKRRQDVALRRQNLSESTLLELIRDMPPARMFANTLIQNITNGQIGLIAEIKSASPSQGEIRPGFDPASCASAYAAGGASCLSVLTEPHWFNGKDSYIADVKAVTTLPVLRKDFIIDPYQVLESRYIGADCILVIMAALDDAMARDICLTARDAGLDILVEVHNKEERDRALKLDFDLLGINNRNLKTMQIDTNTTIELARDITRDVTIVSESGLNTHEDLCLLMEHDIKAFLVGTSLMREKDLKAATQRLLGKA